MPLDLWINGTGFGETILLRWEEDGVLCGGIVDCHSVRNPETDECDIVQWLEEIGVGRLRFAVATHPHLDHLQNFHTVLKQRGKEVDAFYYWGVLDWATWVESFDCLLDNKVNEKKPGLVDKAYHARELLAETGKLSQGRMKLCSAGGHRRIFPLDGGRSDIEVHSFSPWKGPRLNFLRHVGMSIDRRGGVTEGIMDANAVSLGLIVEYGRSEIVLGGDVEAPNWCAFRATGRSRKLDPCLVKVSHHGSTTGCIRGMWSGGFFGRHKDRPIAVVTSWLGRLPEPKVLRTIRRGARELYVTGQYQAGRGRSLRSFVHVQVDDQNNAEVVDHSPNAGDPLGA